MFDITTKEYNLPNNLTVIQFRALSDNYGYLVHKRGAKTLVYLTYLLTD